MKKYNKPTIQVIELSVKESLSALPNGFARGRMGSLGIKESTLKNITLYNKTSAVKQG